MPATLAISPVVARAATPVASPSPRLDYLDTVRGLAALSVIGSHYVLAYGLPRWEWAMTFTPLHIWWDGYAAVSLFFVLSGLVLSLRYFKAPEHAPLDRFQLSAYVVSRMCRIWLPYCVVMVLSAALWFAAANRLNTTHATSEWFRSLWSVHPSFARLTREFNLTDLHNDFASVPQAWSLAVELVLSLLVPIGVLVAMRGTSWLILAAVVAAKFALMSPFVFHFAIGIALAKHFRQLTCWLEQRLAVRLLALCAGWLLYSWRYLLMSTNAIHRGNVDWYITATGAALLLAVVASSPSLRRLFSIWALRHLGRISYSIYLCHFAVLICLTPRMLPFIDRFAPHATWGMGLALTVAAVMVISDPLYRFVEVPTMALGRWLATKMICALPWKIG